MPIKVDAVENGTRWRLTNTTGKELHDVSGKLWVLAGGVWYEYKRERWDRWQKGGELLGQVNYNQGIQEAEFSIRSNEGRAKGVFDAAVTPVAKPDPGPTDPNPEGVWVLRPTLTP